MKTGHGRMISLRSTIVLLYFFSGASALIYEIVWARMLGLIVGTAVTAWAAVLVAYMGGMALGSFLGGRVADRVVRPVLFFALCEAGIGLFGIASPAILHCVQQFCTVLPPLPGMQTTLAVMVLIVPAMLMGATFPVVGRILVAGDRPPSRDLGMIYSANTSGAVIGTLAAGFLLMPAMGMAMSLFMAAAINLAVASGAALCARTCKGGNRGNVSPVERGDFSSEGSVPGWLFPAVLACSGFCAMAFEVLWSRALVFFLTSTTYSFTVVLSVVLAGLAGGGLAAAAIAKKRPFPVPWFAALQLFIGVYGFATLFFLQNLDSVVHFNESHVTNVWWHWIGVRYAACFAVIFPAAFCMGATFPLAVGASCRSFHAAGRSIGALTSLNTVGGIAGSLAAAFLLIPVAGIQRSLAIVAVINCAAGLAVMGWGMRASLVRTAAGVCTVILLFVISLVFSGRHPMVLYSHAVRNADGPVSILSYKEDQSASVAVLGSSHDRKLNIDGFNAAGTYRYEYMHLLAHLPVLLSPSPDTVLVVCFGSGTTCGTAALYPRVKRVDCAEISPAVIASARYFVDVNYHAADNPKVRIILGDGRNHLLRTERRYDCITLEPMLPYMASATNLYSADFYRLCRSRLTAHGVMAQWAPMHVLSPREYRMLIATFASVFPHTSLWFLGTEGILIGTMDPLRIDLDSLEQKMSPDAPMADLAKISLTDPARLLSCFLMDEQRVREYVGNVPVISDDLHGLEFSAPHNRVLPISRMWLENVNELLLNRVTVLPYIVKTNDSMNVEIDRCREASSFIMKAGIYGALWQFPQAVAMADSALRLMPGDTTARMIRRETAVNVMQFYLNEARISRSQGDLRAAEHAYLQALAIDSLCAPVQSELAGLYIALGIFDKVLEYAQKAVASSPDDPAMHTNLAVVYLNLNRPADAEKELLRAISINDDFGRAYFFLGSLYRETGRNAEAGNAFKRVEELGYHE
ncbi:MAG: fused MFS/spermidine synthase [Chitinispirillaceae bacterium]|nr:fused MFS/spermidine synthase [Chitinispirillaceae bacterium]